MIWCSSSPIKPLSPPSAPPAGSSNKLLWISLLALATLSSITTCVLHYDPQANAYTSDTLIPLLQRPAVYLSAMTIDSLAFGTLVGWLALRPAPILTTTTIAPSCPPTAPSSPAIGQPTPPISLLSLASCEAPREAIETETRYPCATFPYSAEPRCREPIYCRNAKRSATNKLYAQTYYALRAYAPLPFATFSPFTMHSTSSWLTAHQKIAHESHQSGSAVVYTGRSGEDHALLPQAVAISLGNSEPIETFNVIVGGIFDGHADGGRVGGFCKSRFVTTLQACMWEDRRSPRIDEETVTNALTCTFLRLHERCKAMGGGTTATLFLEAKNYIFFANAGDSRAAVVKQGGMAYALTEDAKASSRRFHKGIGAKGSFVNRVPGDATERVFHHERGPIVPGLTARGGYAPARDIGEEILANHPKISWVLRGHGEDDVEQGRINVADGDLLIIASDGYWDVIDLQETGQAVEMMREQGFSPKLVAMNLVRFARENWEAHVQNHPRLSRADIDDISVMVYRIGS